MIFFLFTLPSDRTQEVVVFRRLKQLLSDNSHGKESQRSFSRVHCHRHEGLSRATCSQKNKLSPIDRQFEEFSPSLLIEEPINYLAVAVDTVFYGNEKFTLFLYRFPLVKLLTNIFLFIRLTKKSWSPANILIF